MAQGNGSTFSPDSLSFVVITPRASLACFLFNEEGEGHWSALSGDSRWKRRTEAGSSVNVFGAWNRVFASHPPNDCSSGHEAVRIMRSYFLDVKPTQKCHGAISFTLFIRLLMVPVCAGGNRLPLFLFLQARSITEGDQRALWKL